MFEHRTLAQRLLIRKIHSFNEDTVTGAQRELIQVVGIANMPYSDAGLKALLNRCQEKEKIDAGGRKRSGGVVHAT